MDTPFVMVALTVTVPALVVLSVLPLILAPVPPALCTLHVMAWFVAFIGTVLPDRLSGTPTVAVVGTPVIFVTGI